MLPPGQRAVEGFPRFGTHFSRPAPAVPSDPEIRVTGAVTDTVIVPLSDLATMPRRTLTSDFHCVSGWSATDLTWDGVTLADFYREVIEPALAPGSSVHHVVFGGLDGYSSIITIEDALADDVLIADRLDGKPLHSDHGAPVRLVSPGQYGYMSTKHLCEIEVHTSPPRRKYHPYRFLQLGLRLVTPHRRARVWQEERHEHLPGWLVRPVYRQLIGPIASLSRRGSRP
jgi:DMSO/TMAO reductase YedYZ molybdopterin-dependent catalytic subunit